jgi:hypothetical protein
MFARKFRQPGELEFLRKCGRVRGDMTMMRRTRKVTKGHRVDYPLFGRSRACRGPGSGGSLG